MDPIPINLTNNDAITVNKFLDSNIKIDNLDKSEIFNDFLKLITNHENGLIFNNPIVYNGKVYEKTLFYSNIKNINGNVVRFIPLKSLIKHFLDAYPEYKKYQFVEIISLMAHHEHEMDINKIMDTGNYEKLLDYTCFSISLLTEVQLHNFFIKSNIDIIKHFFSKCLNLIDLIKGTQYNILFFILKYFTKINKPNLVNLLIELDNDKKLLYTTYMSETPLHYIYVKSINGVMPVTLILKLIDVYLNDNGIYTIDENNNSIIELLWSYSSEEILDYLMSKINIQDTNFTNLVPSILDKMYNNGLLSDSFKEKYFNLLV